MTYPTVIEQLGPEDFLVTFPDVAEAITGAASYEAARALAADCLDTAADGYLKLGGRFPRLRKS